MEMKRLDILISERNEFSREYSKELIKKSLVSVNGKIITKPAEKIHEDVEIIISEPEKKFVSRGGLKLDYALSEFNIELENKTCVDIGAATGGFTDCMLQHGAKKVYAIDVGTNQLVKELLEDPRVVSLEQTNIKNVSFEDLGEKAEFASVDVSFISLTKVLPGIRGLLLDDAAMVCLIKPQFEAGREHLSKNGIVYSEKIHKKVVETIKEFATEVGFSVLGLIESPITGKEGNVEFLIYLKAV